MQKLSTKPDRDNPVWSDEDFRRAKPAADVLPAALAAALPRERGQRGPQREPAKQLLSLRIRPRCSGALSGDRREMADADE